MSGHVREWLSAYLDGELPPLERSRVDAHLAECPACAAHLSELAAVDSALGGLALPETSDDAAFAARVRARIEAEEARAPKRQREAAVRRLPAWVWPAAAALLLAVLTPLTLRQLRPSGELPQGAAGSAATRAPGRTGNDVPRGAGAPSESLGLVEGKGAVAPAAAPPPHAFAPASEPARRGTALSPSGSIPRETEAAAPTPAREEAPPTASLPAPAPPAAVEGAASRVAAETAPSVETRVADDLADRGADGVAGGVVGDVVDGGKTAADAPARVAADRERLAEQHPAEPRGGLAHERQKAAKTPAAVGFADKPASAGETAAFARLAAQRARTPEEWRQLRAAWRELARVHSSDPLGDEALVRSIEAAAGAYRASTDSRDADVLERDVAEYLARRDATQGERVRRLLSEAKR